MVTPIASVIVPISQQHVFIAARAIASANAQTIPCVVLPIVDDGGMGAGWARNRGIEQATTDFLIFLDSDDTLAPTFAERCWGLFQQTNRYIFTDFFDDSGSYHQSPDCPWQHADGEPVNAHLQPMERAHAVTTFLPTAWARAVDGFDETMDGGEDSEFYIHLCTEGFCGTRLPEALFTYTNAPDGRSKRWRASGGVGRYENLIRERYTDKGKAMACCTEPAKPLINPDRAAPDKVLARPRWVGNRQERGVVTGTRYPNADNARVLEIDPRDAAARPDRWEVLQRPTPVPKPIAPMVAIQPTPDLHTLAQRALQVKPPPAQPPTPPPPAPITPVMPNVERVTRLAQRLNPNIALTKDELQAVRKGAMLEVSDTELKINRPFAPDSISRTVKGEWRSDAGADYFVPADAVATEQALKELTHVSSNYRPHLDVRIGDPVFVFPEKDYPSYTDVRRLVELSGFQAQKQGELNLDDWKNPAQTVVFIAPEQPDFFVNQVILRDIGSRAHLIWWTLEYGGEYEPDLTNWRGEVWASDPAWAKAHDAKMVVMGSHPDLKPPVYATPDLKYDVTMLAYMTPRREQIKAKLVDLSWPSEIYPGYGQARAGQLIHTKLMLHVHQRDDTHAIAPQRIALAAAYQLPIICESVPDAGEYGRWIPFVGYDNLNGEVRSQLAMMSEEIPQARAERLHNWLCVENTFRMSVEKALKG